MRHALEQADQEARKQTNNLGFAAVPISEWAEVERTDGEQVMVRFYTFGYIVVTKDNQLKMFRSEFM